MRRQPVKTVKLNAQVSEPVRDAVRELAAYYKTTVQAVMALCVRVGLRHVSRANRSVIVKHLGKDGRRK